MKDPACLVLVEAARPVRQSAVAPAPDRSQSGVVPRDRPQTAQPFSWPIDHHDCAPAQMCNTTRCDSTRTCSTFHSPGESWCAYAWCSNSEVLAPFDHVQLGEHVNLVKVNASDPQWVSCQTDEATKVWAVSPHDQATIVAMNASCPRCSEQLSFTTGRHGETMMRDGVVWGVGEAPMLFRRNGWVYLLASHSAWDSAFYSVMWIASQTVEGLDLANGATTDTRLVGRFLIPSRNQSFDHGTAAGHPRSGR